MLTCKLLGHRPAFTAQGATMTWRCERGCGFGGSKHYESPQRAARFAAAFDRRDRDDLGRRAPLIGLFPLRLWYRLRSGRAAQPKREGVRR